MSTPKPIGEFIDPGKLTVHLPPPAPASQPILETEYINPSDALALTKSSATWASDRVQGRTFLSGLTNTAPFEWTQAVSPNDEFETDLIGLSGTCITPDLSGGDNPFLHPFCTDPSVPNKWDYEFFIAPDAAYQFLAAPNPTSASGISSHSEYIAATTAAQKDFGITVTDVVGVETDRNLVPLAYRPLHGDRVCVWGRWIVDTGHDDFHTEIHPPLLVVAGRPSGDSTVTTIVARPYLVGQTFSDGPMEAHLLNEVGKVLSFRSTKLEAHPTIMPKPWNGTFLMSYTIRPPKPRQHAQDVLFVKYNLVTRTGVVAQLVNPGDDSVKVFLVMNSNLYVAAPLPAKHNPNITLSELKQLNPSAGSVYEDVIFASILANPVYAPLVLSTGIETDAYDMPLANSAHNGQFTRVPVTTLSGNTPIPVDQSQPFPIYGTIELDWQRYNPLAGIETAGGQNVLEAE